METKECKIFQHVLYASKYVQRCMKCLSCTPGSHSVCAVSSRLEVDRKILSIRREPMLSGFFSLYKCLELLPHIEWLPGVQLRHFSPTCAVHIEDCGGWWLSGCCSSVAEHWLHKPKCPGFDSRQLPAFSLSSTFAS